MGGGGKGGGCQTVGYGYALTMIYALCEKADYISAFAFNDEVSYSRDIEYVMDIVDSGANYSFDAWTGTKGTVYSSDYGEATIRVCMGHQQLLRGYPVTEKIYHEAYYEYGVVGDYHPAWTENTETFIEPAIKGIAYAYFQNAFVGDNTTSVPKYDFRLSRFYLPNIEKPSELKNYRVGKWSINPAAIIFDILHTYVEIPYAKIDIDGFKSAAATLAEEKLGVSFVMTTEKNITDWIKEILRTIDGSLYLDPITHKWTMLLFRKNYEEDNVLLLDENNTSELKIETGGWDNIYSTYTFKYTDIATKNTNSFTITNTAIKKVIGYDRANTYTYQLICENACMNQVANRVLQKNSKPLSSLKARVSIVEYSNLGIGQVVKVKSEKLTIPTMYFRITKVGADSEEQTYVDIEGIQEVFSTIDYKELYAVETTTLVQDYNIADETPDAVDIIELPSQLCPELNRKFVYIAVSQPSKGKVVQQCNIKTNDTTADGGIIAHTEHTYIEGHWYTLKLDADIPANTPDFDREFEIPLLDETGNGLFITQLNDESWQSGYITAIINDEHLSIQSILPNGSDAYKLKGVMRGLLGNKKEHSAGDTVWIYKSTTGLQTIPADSAGIKVTAMYSNIYYTSKEKEASKTLDGIAYRAMPVANAVAYINEDDDNLHIKFIPTLRIGGATIVNIDTISSDEYENKIDTNVFDIYKNGDLFDTVKVSDSTTLVVDYNTEETNPDSDDNWTIYAKGNGSTRSVGVRAYNNF